MPGWRFKPGNAEITVFAGLDIQHHRLTPDDPGNPSRGTHAGLRARRGFLVGADGPTMMPMPALSFATIGDGYWARVAYGWRFFDSIYIGPKRWRSATTPTGSGASAHM